MQIINIDDNTQVLIPNTEVTEEGIRLDGIKYEYERQMRRNKIGRKKNVLMVILASVM